MVLASEILEVDKLSVIGTVAVVNVNHSRSYRRIWCSPHHLLENIDTRGVCFYWLLLLKLKIKVLFFRSILVSNFLLCIVGLKIMVKWMFALYHHHFACKKSIHLFGLMKWHSNCPAIFDQLSKRTFLLRKTGNRTTSIAKAK